MMCIIQLSYKKWILYKINVPKAKLNYSDAQFYFLNLFQIITQ
jgi:hypothetical protein